MKKQMVVSVLKGVGLVALAALPGVVMASTGGGTAMPWDGALDNVLDALQHGTAPKVVGLAVVGAGFAAVAGDSGGMGKKLGTMAMAGGAVLAGAGPVVSLLGAGGLI